MRNNPEHDSESFDSGLCLECYILSFSPTGEGTLWKQKTTVSGGVLRGRLLVYSFIRLLLREAFHRVGGSKEKSEAKKRYRGMHTHKDYSMTLSLSIPISSLAHYK